jgi:hypothetical protein
MFERQRVWLYPAAPSSQLPDVVSVVYRSERFYPGGWEGVSEERRGYSSEGKQGKSNDPPPDERANSRARKKNPDRSIGAIGIKWFRA